MDRKPETDQNSVDLRESERQRAEELAARQPDPAGPPVAPEGGADHPLSDADLRTITGGEDFGVYRAHRRFGGFDPGAAFAGLLAAVGMTVLIGGIAGAVGTISYQMDVQRDTETLSGGGFIAGLVVLLLSFLVSGWVAGRVARYDGGKNGVAAAVLFLVLSAVLAALGAALGDQYDVFANVALPQWFTANTNTGLAVLSAVVALVVMVASAWFGGRIGSRYHRKADAYLAEYAGANAAGVTGRAVVNDSIDRDDRVSLRHLLHR